MKNYRIITYLTRRLQLRYSTPIRLQFDGAKNTIQRLTLRPNRVHELLHRDLNKEK